jgi:methionine aminopeptidase
MRLVKDEHEQDIMRRAAQISAQAHVRAMQRSARMIRNGEEVREYHLDAELLHEFRQHGSQYVAYGSIVAAGANACVLHYQADKAPVRAGELVLIDAGCELDGYASDITRTFPADGKFSGRSVRCTSWCWPARKRRLPSPGPASASTTRMTPPWPCWPRACWTWDCWTVPSTARPRM